MAEQPVPEDPAEGDQVEKERQESLWASFNRADMRLLIVTFAGTVAANVVTVMVVAIAIIVARSQINGPLAPRTVLAWLTGVGFGCLSTVWPCSFSAVFAVWASGTRPPGRSIRSSWPSGYSVLWHSCSSCSGMQWA